MNASAGVVRPGQMAVAYDNLMHGDDGEAAYFHYTKVRSTSGIAPHDRGSVTIDDDSVPAVGSNHRQTIYAVIDRRQDVSAALCEINGIILDICVRGVNCAFERRYVAIRNVKNGGARCLPQTSGYN